MYLDFYGLTEMPFTITPNPRFLYFSNRHRDAFEQLLYGIESRKGFIMLTGEVGSGKTTLCRAVLSHLTQRVKTALILNPMLTDLQLIRAVLSDLGLDTTGRDRLSYFERLNAFLLEQASIGNNVALLIDEAQDLSPALMEQVRLLSNLETDQHKLLQIVLCGQPELGQRLAQTDLRQLRQRITVRCNIEPLSEEETGEYIAHRLRVAGADESIGFRKEAVDCVYGYSHGIPRLTNAVCDNAMLAGYVARTKQLDYRCVERAIQQLEGTL